MSVMPAQKPGVSKQDYATPHEFLDAVERRFGPIACDLAAHGGNTVCKWWCGPGSPMRECEDSLQVDWYLASGLLWLNPPYARIAPWAAKCALESQRGARIAFLVPASVGANWYWDHVAPYARVYALSPRLSFDSVAPYPKDLILAMFDSALTPGFERWLWKRS